MPDPTEMAQRKMEEREQQYALEKEVLFGINNNAYRQTYFSVISNNKIFARNKISVECVH